MANESFSQKVKAGNTVWSAGAYDALSAKLIEAAGFESIMTTGFGVSASHLGAPDMELYTMSENLDVVRNVVNSVSVPVIADTDTGYGNALNVMRTVREFEQVGAAAMIFEDQESPKRCPAAAGQVDIISVEEGAAKIRAAVQARRNPDTIIIARTDAMQEDDAIERARAYVEAGADLIQPISKCFKDFAGLQRIREACGRPLSLQILGWLETDLQPAQIQEVAGLAVFPLVGLMTATAALKANLAALAAAKNTANLPMPVTSMADFKTFIGFEEMEQLQTTYLMTREVALTKD
ncbi:MAG: oxaloacetate decarboxylase [Burkholderiaceae bacterium]